MPNKAVQAAAYPSTALQSNQRLSGNVATVTIIERCASMKFEQIRQMPVVYRIPGMEQVHVQKNIPYTQDRGVELCLDIYQPAQISEQASLPGVLIVPSGPLTLFERFPPKD